ncbi:MAG: two-component system chemotaxis response regulator CheB [Myxococcota bacterium]|jgi:two-component system chemotaxis response regulator CheB
MDGLAVLREIRSRDASLPVIMFSSSTGLETKVTIEAMLLGASDCVEKNAVSVIGAIAELIPRIKVLSQEPGDRRRVRRVSNSVSITSAWPTDAPAARLDPIARLQALIPRRQEQVRLIAIGVWIAPGGRHMTICVDRLMMTDAVPENSCRPAVDVLFRSAAKAYGRGCSRRC